MPIEKTCVYCKKTFKIPQRRSETVKFCSLECKTEAGRQSHTCLTCGKTFERARSASREPIKYCSRKCYHAKSKGAAKKPKSVSSRYFQVCEVCKKAFPVTLTRTRTARFCSRACQSKSQNFREEMSVKQRGEKSWRWNGGEYQGKWGYVRVKSKRLDAEVARLIHRVVIEQAMLAQEPNHPFLIEVDGVKMLNPQIEVHHIDRDRSNNALSNLLAVTKYAHAQIHHKDRKPNPWECWPSNPVKW